MSTQLDNATAYQQPFERVVAALGSDALQGLSDGEARVPSRETGVYAEDSR
jgi:hypothetical protein